MKLFKKMCVLSYCNKYLSSLILRILVSGHICHYSGFTSYCFQTTSNFFDYMGVGGSVEKEKVYMKARHLIPVLWTSFNKTMKTWILFRFSELVRFQ